MASTRGDHSDIKPTHSVATLNRRLKQRIIEFDSSGSTLVKRTGQQPREMQLGTGFRENLLDLASPVAEALSQPKTMTLISPLTHFYTHTRAGPRISSIISCNWKFGNSFQLIISRALSGIIQLITTIFTELLHWLYWALNQAWIAS